MTYISLYFIRYTHGEFSIIVDFFFIVCQLFAELVASPGSITNRVGDFYLYLGSGNRMDGGVYL